jgi:hypothetical protein
MASKLTAATVLQAKAGQARREIPDGGCAGLYLVIQPNGAKSWAVRYRSPTDLEELTFWQPREPKSGVLAQWSGRDIISITKRDVLDLLDAIVESAPAGANRTLSALKTAFTWCAKRDILTVSPCDHVDDPSPESSVERDLSVMGRLGWQDDRVYIGQPGEELKRLRGYRRSS